MRLYHHIIAAYNFWCRFLSINLFAKFYNLLNIMNSLFFLLLYFCYGYCNSLAVWGGYLIPLIVPIDFLDLQILLWGIFPFLLAVKLLYNCLSIRMAIAISIYVFSFYL